MEDKKTTKGGEYCAYKEERKIYEKFTECVKTNKKLC
jgi:hypothetical protein